jgi:hypothetical protein
MQETLGNEAGVYEYHEGGATIAYYEGSAGFVAMRRVGHADWVLGKKDLQRSIPPIKAYPPQHCQGGHVQRNYLDCIHLVYESCSLVGIHRDF